MNDRNQSTTFSDEPQGAGCLFQIKDHLEMIVVAFIMALVIRCFFVEVFKIPTGSMEPTLMGNNERTGEGGDRIMVNKFYYLFHSVDRFDVIVFRYPLNVMRNFIKRAVGIGPEYVRMEKGDIYHAKNRDDPFRIARKSFDKQQSIWIPLPAGTSGQQGVDILDTWEWEGANGTSHNSEYLNLQGKQTTDKLTFNQPLRDAAVTVADQRYQTGFNRVKDVKIRSVISHLNESDRLVYELYDGTYRFSLRIAGDDNGRLIVNNTENKQEPKEISLMEAGRLRNRRSTVELFVYDGQVGVILDGELLEKHVYRNRYSQISETRNRRSGQPQLEVTSGSIRLHKLSLYRDIHYHWGKGNGLNFDPRNEPVRIPENRILVIGDNVNSSRDSRKWKMNVIELEDGSRYYVDNRTWKRSLSNRRSHVVDRSGRRFKPSELTPRKKTTVKPLRFVRKELLVGKAIWVWWPYDRIKFIK